MASFCFITDSVWSVRRTTLDVNSGERSVCESEGKKDGRVHDDTGDLLSEHIQVIDFIRINIFWPSSFFVPHATRGDAESFGVDLARLSMREAKWRPKSDLVFSLCRSALYACI